MARARGGDDVSRKKSGTKGSAKRPRQVYIFAEGEVTELEYIDIILREGTPADPDRKVNRHFENDTAPSKYRKPLPMVKEAVRTLRKVERAARDAGLDKDKSWNWPEVWVLFDRDRHENIQEAMKQAAEAGVKCAYSHPCFELWRLLHYQDYTSTFGGVCDSASDRLRQQRGFAQTYGRNVRTVSEQQAKHMKDGQVIRTPDEDRFEAAKGRAERMNKRNKHGHPDGWDTYTDVYEFVEKGLLLSGY